MLVHPPDDPRGEPRTSLPVSKNHGMDVKNRVAVVTGAAVGTITDDTLAGRVLVLNRGQPPSLLGNRE